jgi:hypothetical protein
VKRHHGTECVIVASISPHGHNDDVPTGRTDMRAFVSKQHPALLKVYFAACYVVLIEEVIRAIS